MTQEVRTLNRIAALRKERDLSQKELGAIIGVAQNTVCNWENGKREPDFGSLKKMSSFFEHSIDYILGIDATREPPAPKDGDGLSPEQAEVINLYDSAPPAFRAAALALLRSAEGQSTAQGGASPAK